MQQLHSQLIRLNVSAQVKQQRARQPHSRKTRPRNAGTHNQGDLRGPRNVGTTDRNLWPTHKRFGVPGQSPHSSNALRHAAEMHAGRSTLSVASRSSVNSGWTQQTAAPRKAAVKPTRSSPNLPRPVGHRQSGRTRWRNASLNRLVEKRLTQPHLLAAPPSNARSLLAQLARQRRGSAGQRCENLPLHRASTTAFAAKTLPCFLRSSGGFWTYVGNLHSSSSRSALGMSS